MATDHLRLLSCDVGDPDVVITHFEIGISKDMLMFFVSLLSDQTQLPDILHDSFLERMETLMSQAPRPVASDILGFPADQLVLTNRQVAEIFCDVIHCYGHSIYDGEELVATLDDESIDLDYIYDWDNALLEFLGIHV